MATPATRGRGAASLAEPPEFGAMAEVAEGILWLRLPLPYQLDHVNIYLIEEAEGWAVIDTGISDDRTREIWQAVLAGPLRGSRLSRLVVTHHHPDHMGLAGWMVDSFGLPLHMTLTEFLMGKYLGTSPGAISGAFQHRHYARHGAPPEQAQVVVQRGHNYLGRITGLPDTFQTLEPGRVLDIGGRRFTILTGGGHSPDQAMLYCAEEALFLAADQIIERISPNVSVLAAEPAANPLGAFIASLQRIQQQVVPDALTLPGHRLPLTNPHQRADELIAHHMARCDQLRQGLRGGALSVAELTPLLFPRALDPHQLSFAFSETLAHVNFMLETGDLTAAETDGVLRLRAA